MRQFLAMVLAIIGVLGLILGIDYAVDEATREQSEIENMLVAAIADRYYSYPDHIELCSEHEYMSADGTEMISYSFIIDECSESSATISRSALESEYASI